MARIVKPVKPKKTPATPLEAMLEEYGQYMEVRGFSADTRVVRRRHLGMFVRWAQERGLLEPLEIIRPVLERYMRYMFHYRKKNGKPLSFSSQHARGSDVRMWFKWMTRQNYILHNPASELELPRQSKSLPHVLNQEESERILLQPDLTRPVGLRDRAILETFYSTGMRRMELLKLKLYELELGGGIVTIREGKGRKDRVLPIGERACLWIRKYLEEARPLLVVEPDDGTMFLSDEGEPISPNYLSRTIREYIDAAQVTKYGACHLFRHTMATLMLEGGADIRFIQQMLGHSRLDTTEIYTHVSIRMLKQIHSSTHPAAQLKSGSHHNVLPAQPPDEALKAELLARLAEEADEEDEE